MEKLYRLEQQMRVLADIGQEFHSALQEAQARKLEHKFLSDALALMNQLGGGPDAGALQAMRDVNRDVAATRQFIKRWSEYDDRSRYQEVLRAARRTLEALSEFRDIIDSLTPRERAKVEAQARTGHLAMGKGCLVALAVFVFVGFAIVKTIWGGS